MKAIIFKELRENAKWAALMLVAMLIGMTTALYDGFVLSFRLNVFFEGIFAAVFFGSCAAALILGLLQTVLETRRDQWAFLMHRGVSATHIFLGKVVAGICLYVAIVLPPLLLAVVCCSWQGIERFPFEWRMVAPSLIALVAAFGLYFGAMLVAVRQARWYVSRLLPLVLPGLTVLLVPLAVFEINEMVSFSLVVVVLSSVCTMGVAAWGVFIRSGESVNVPARARLCLGAALTVAYVTASLCLVAGVVGLIDEMRREQRTTAPPFTDYRVNSRGHVVRFEYAAVQRSEWYNRKLIRVTDLDEPSARQYEPLANQPMFEQFYKDDVDVTPLWDGLSMSTVRLPYSGGWFPVGPSYARIRLLQRIESSSDVTSVFSTTRGLIYGYRDPQTYRTVNRKPPKLEWIAGPDGFKPPTALPRQRFGRFLAAGSNHWFSWGRFAWNRQQQSGREIWNRNFVLFEDGLYEIDFNRKTVQRQYKPPVGQRIRSISTVGDDRVAIVFDDSIHVHLARSTVVGELEDRETLEKSELRIALPGKKLSSISIPNQVSASLHFEFGKIPDQDLIVFKCQSLAARISPRFVYMRQDGTVTRDQEFPSPTTHIRTGELATICGFAACVPLALAGVLAVVGAISDTTSSMGPGFILRLLIHDPLTAWCMFAVIVLLGLFSGWLARRTARRYGFTNRETLSWVSVAVLLGPAGLLSLYCLRNWPLRQPCHTCRKLSPIDRDACVNCGTGLESPPLDGTEILQAELAVAT